MKILSILLLPTLFQSLQGLKETVLLINNQPLDLEWEKCLNTMDCIKTNVIDRVSDLETKVQNVTFGDYPVDENATLINLSSKIKMKMIQKHDGKIAFRFVANNNGIVTEESRGVHDRHQAAILGFGLILLVLGVVSTTLKVNVFLALLGVAIGKILIFFVYTEHLLKGKKHFHGRPGIHIHKAPVHHYQYNPVQVLEQVPVYHEHHVEGWDHGHHEHYDHLDHHHDDWSIVKKKR